MTDFSKALGEMLRNLRLANGFTQTDLAARLDITPSAYAIYESGSSMPDLEKLRLLAELFSISPEAFFYPEKYQPIPVDQKA